MGSSVPNEMSRSAAARPPRLVVGVGASAGGLAAFTELRRELPADSGMAFVLLQHLDPSHPSQLTELLARATSLPVVEITHGMLLEPDHVYVVPENVTIGVSGGRLVLAPRIDEPGAAPLAIDHFFRALATDCGERAVGLVLSGNGVDGAEGLRAIRAAGGLTFVQEPASATAPGMPEAAIATGVVDVVRPPGALARELVDLGPGLSDDGAGDAEATTPGDEAALARLFAMVRESKRVDLAAYKPATVRRRLRRRMALRRQATLSDYVRLLAAEPSELVALFEDVLIHVTSFFREPEVFALLRASVFPELVARKRAEGGTIRIWCAGCSTGEEAYSLLIALVEYLGEANAASVPIQIFGTDLSERVIDRARRGVYPASAVAELGPARLSRFFQRIADGYRIDGSLRKRCAFVQHDLASDPPFSKLDLVSCRNVLVYFAPELQRRVLGAFHFALHPTGFLLLGHAENISEGSNLFTVSDRGAKLFAPTSAKSAVWFRTPDAAERFSPEQRSPPELVRTGASLADIVRRTDALLLDRYAPPGVIVDERLEILHFGGRTGQYLEPAPGQPHHDLLKMIRKGLLSDVRAATSEARSSNKTVRRAAVLLDDDGGRRPCEIVVIPVLVPSAAGERVLVVLFEEARAGATGAGEPGASALVEARAVTVDPRVAILEEELRATKEYLQAIIQQQQQAHEVLIAANEELVSSNEELQTLNEEYQAGKEELQAANEELGTLNEDLRARNVELAALNGDLTSVLATIDVPLVIVDANRRVRRFTSEVRPVLELADADVGRPIGAVRSTLVGVDLDRRIADAITSLLPYDEEVCAEDGRWYRLQIRVYATNDRRIDGVVVTLLDIDTWKTAIRVAEGSRDLARAISDAVLLPEIVLDEALTVLSVSQTFEATYGVRRDCVGTHLRDLLGGSLDSPVLRSALARVVAGDERIDRLELACAVPGRGRRTLLVSSRRVTAPSGKRVVLVAAEDVTDRARGSDETDRLLDAAPDAVVITNRRGAIVRVNAQTERLFGYTRDELLGKAVEVLLPARFAEAHPRLRQVYGEAPAPRTMGTGSELYARRRDGTEFPVEVSLSPTGAGEALLVSAAIRDITDRKAIDTSLRRSLTEKEVLLKEVHHRVKNNLQVVSSMLKLHAEQANESAARAFQDSQDRVRAIALLHETLYQSKDLGNVDLHDYAAGLVRVLRDSTGGTVAVAVRGEHIAVPLTLAVPCGLVLNELVTNACKHAFPYPVRADAEIAVSFERIGDGIEVSVADNGVGLPPGFDPATSRTLGMHLMQMMSRQLGGSLSFDGRSGTRCTLVFSETEG